MTITERINDSLSRGRLNYGEIKKIIGLDEARHLYDSRGENDKVILYGELITQILDRADLTIGERLTVINEENIK
jgi:hypothetical protein